MVRWFRAAAAAVALAVIAACTPAATSTPAPTTTTSAQPTYLCTAGTQTASPFPCDKARYDEQQKTKALEDEAKAVYERYWKEYTRLLAAGGASEATPELKATTTGAFLQNVVALLKYQSEKGWTPRPFVISQKSKIVASPLKPDAEVSMIVCEDSRGTVLVDRSGSAAGKGVLAVQNLALKRVDGAMRIYDSTSDGVTSCPFES